MEISTKYNLNDTVWVVSGNKVIQKLVTMYKIKVDNTHKVKVTYQLNHDDIDVDESKLFASKEELLKSL